LKDETIRQSREGLSLCKNANVSVCVRKLPNRMPPFLRELRMFE